MSENDPQDPANTGGGADYRSDRRSIMGLNTTFLVGGIALLVAGIAAAILLLNSGQDPASFNGSMIEVEPDVILVAYPESMGEIRPSYIRAQRIRITPEGPVPVAF